MDQSTPDTGLDAELDTGPGTPADAGPDSVVEADADEPGDGDEEPTGADTEPAGADAGSATGAQVAELTERQRQIIDFERRWWRHAGAKEQAVRDTFGLSATRYYQVLNALLDEPAALAYDPILVNRLRRLRATRLRARTARRP